MSTMGCQDETAIISCYQVLGVAENEGLFLTAVAKIPFCLTTYTEYFNFFPTNQ